MGARTVRVLCQLARGGCAVLFFAACGRIDPGAAPTGAAGNAAARAAGVVPLAGAAAGSGGVSVAATALAGEGAGRAGGGAPGFTAVGGAAGGMRLAPGGAGQGEPALVPVERAGKYVLERGALSFDPAHGARVTRLAWRGQNLLTGPDIDMLNYGSTFWPSPQARWSWPPVPELDSAAYTARVEGDALSCSSQPGTRARVSVHKRVRAGSAADGVELEYTLTNDDSVPASWAPWEITRVAAGGLSFFPTGERVQGAQLPVTNQGGVTWYRHDPAALAGGGQKFSADGAEGFIAHVAGRTLFVKQFMDVPPAQQAPAPEAEIAIYAAAGYVELEPQGAYTALMPGQSVTWRVRWRLSDVPDEVPIAVGSGALVQLARSLLTR